ncbi:MAG: DNA primase [Candidatus Kerfeldbacteria bacterium CG_4_10_14_0_8_um_filter_42_10]|uniref:DNA primase n=1 Tax=Candidatus Kerfeldbacteria bacterium CG_4_10_14_0_8_um_filter_42_10 TaxID=2014248 RepID=A0A2M7RG84_9BACT|nr:MAG: DNA primase [Candidatus Kerfeldbacteria bacterium CG_4_10_14_0_8_um_filter_42_10]
MTDSTIEEIKNRLDIVEVLQEFIQLRKSGANFKAPCPFHNEKTPSFMVSPEKQIWHCFGCGEGGDIFGFVMKIEGVEFPEALRILAKKAGVELRREDPALQNKRTRLLDICKLTAAYYHKVLLESPKAEFVREYLKSRKIDPDAIEQFKLGYSPDSWDFLFEFLKKKEYSEEEIFLAGLTVKKEKGVGYYDRFRNRLMFPINDIHGNTVGFGARTLQKEEQGAKYINSPETLIYNKSHILYGLDQAKTSIRKEDSVIVVEGYTDCISAHQAGITNVVASSGTALTEGHLKLIKRHTSNIIMAFDRDAAGAEAAKRGIEVALMQEMNIKVLELLSGKDPDEAIKENKDAFLKAVKEAKPYLQYYFDNTFKNFDLSRVEDKKRAAAVLLPIIVKIANGIEQSHWLKELAKKIDVSEEILKERIRKTVKSPGAPVQKVTAEGSVKPISRFLKIGEELLSLLLYFPEQISLAVKELVPEYFIEQKQSFLYKNLVIYYTKKEQFNISEFQQQLFSEKNDESAAYLDILLLLGEENFSDLAELSVKQYIKERINLLKRNVISLKLKAIEQKIKVLEEQKTSQNQEEFDTLSQKFIQLTNQLRQLE